MKTLNILVYFFIAVGLFSCQNAPIENTPVAFDPLPYVKPFIGTGAHGHTFPGAATLFEAVQLSPDTHLVGWEASSGYHYEDSVIYGFSHIHLSGTGTGDLGDTLLLLFNDSLSASFEKEHKRTGAGHYSVKFSNFSVNSSLLECSYIPPMFYR